VQHSGNASSNNKIDAAIMQGAKNLDQMTILGSLRQNHTVLNHGRWRESSRRTF
jgi:hypothetical protein